MNNTTSSMEYDKVDSSSIDAVAYDAETSTLGLRFHVGRDYLFFDVPPNEVSNLLAASSIGRYFVRHLKGAGYAYRRVN